MASVTTCDTWQINALIRNNPYLWDIKVKLTVILIRSYRFQNMSDRKEVESDETN